jgi:hypothetical protein
LNAGTPASETVIPTGLYENTTSADGEAVLFNGDTRTEPESRVASVPAVTSLKELRRGMPYVKLFSVCPFAVIVKSSPEFEKN